MGDVIYFDEIKDVKAEHDHIEIEYHYDTRTALLSAIVNEGGAQPLIPTQDAIIELGLEQVETLIAQLKKLQDIIERTDHDQ